ncbi:MAG: hypothetical protein AAFQ41_04650 [Cyanobacteria bacterium J06623_7]
MKLKKLGNWFSDEEPEKNEPKDQPASPTNEALAKQQLKIDKLQENLQSTQKELAQAEAQLQIYQGFQIELGETQLRLQQNQVELQRYKKELFERQKQFSQLEGEHKSAQQTLAKISEGKDWLKQLGLPVRVVDIQKKIPKGDFETLWGFGIVTPKVDTMSAHGAILVRGWVLGKKSESQTVRVLYQGKILLDTEVNCRRLGVAQRYPDITAAANSGFEFSLAVAGIPAETELCLEAVLKDNTVIPLCNLLLTPENESIDT